LYAGIDGLGVLDELRSLRMSPPLRAWIRGFAPDVVYSQLGNLPMMSLVEQIIDEFDCPLALHIMDDWPSFLYRSGALQGVVRADMERRMRSLTNRAASLLTISDAMAAEYEARYGRAFLSFHNPVDLKHWDELAAAYRVVPSSSADRPLHIVYAGRVGTGNADSVLDVAEIVSEMSSRGERIAMQVNTPDADTPVAIRIAEYPGVVVTPGGEYARVPSLMEAADILLLPLDFDERSVRLMRLSMPTKVSEYLASGRPVLTYAPRGSATADYARGDEWSIVVDERDPAALRRALESLIHDDALRRDMGTRARQCAVENHDAGRVRTQFRAALTVGAARA